MASVCAQCTVCAQGAVCTVCKRKLNLLLFVHQTPYECKEEIALRFECLIMPEYVMASL
jgi:hypothetical protein